MDQRRHDEVFRAFALAETTLGPAPADSDRAWWTEWAQIQIARMWLHYWRNEVREMTELAARVRPAVEHYATPAQRSDFFNVLGGMASRRDRYVGLEEASEYFRQAVGAAQESGNPRALAAARFGLGFTHLWSGQLEEADGLMQAALLATERAGDALIQARCLTYLTIVRRKRQQVEEVRRYAARSLAAATSAHLSEYVGAARCNLAWVSWREGNLSEAQAQSHAARELWQQMPLVYPFQWMALWPLIGVMLAQHRIREAIDQVRALLAPNQQPLPAALTACLEAALQAGPETASAHLKQATELARETGYL